ncbi:MAG: aminopeptidase P family protein [Anaerolineales bacterium]
MEPKEKIAELRRLMLQYHIDAWIVLSTDPHQSEYPPERWKARAWLSGFKGSAGIVVVTQKKAGLWTDPRYHIRALQELAGSGIELFKFGQQGVPSYTEWLYQELEKGSVVGFDGNVVSMSEFARLRKEFEKKLVTFVTQYDLVGMLWQDRPGIPESLIFIHEDKFAGETRQSKFQRIRDELRKRAAQVHLLTALDDIAWTFNIRGSDVEYNPVAISYAAILEQDARLFIQTDKVPADVRSALEKDGVIISDYEDVFSYLQKLPAETAIFVDPEKTVCTLGSAIPAGCRVQEGSSIPYLLKARKNDVELIGIHASQVRDGAALVKWMCWLDGQIEKVAHTEITVAEKLTEFRSQGEYFRGLSFGTICGYQANSAVGHYSSNPETVPFLYPEGILLIDSGAQYLDGTTDITRTLTLGNPTSEQKRVYTIVLKCHIKLATHIFPKGTRGDQLDAVARELFWQQGWNCRHGIGHGVGYFLNVHEGPQRFRDDNSTPLELNMLTSNEPGVYFEGKFGVRLENLVVTVPKGTTEFGEFYGFDTVTLCPFDLDLIETSMLSLEERNWLNEYHQRVYDMLAPLLSDEERIWLQHETRQI